MTNQQATISKVFEAESIKNLQLTTFAGDIELIGNDENTIKVEVFAKVRSWKSMFLDVETIDFFDPEINQLSIEIIGDKLQISSKPNYFHPYNWFNFQKTSFRISLPKTINSDTKTYGGNIFLRNLESNHFFSTWGGNLLIEGSKGILKGKTMGGKVEVVGSDANIEAKTWGGNVFLIENQGEINVRTLGGNISIQNQKGKVHATTSGGNIKGDGLFGELKCSTSGGNIKLYNITGNVGASTHGGNIKAEVKAINEYLWLDTSGGNLNAVLPLHQGLNLDIYGNKIVMPIIQNFEGYRTQNELNGKLNGGGASVKIKVAGNIRISESLLKEQNEPSNFAPKKEKTTSNNHISINLYSFLFALAFCLLLTYGLSSITYFTLEIVNPKSIFANIYKGVFFSNIANGLASLCAVFIFIFFIDNRIQKNWIKYLSIIILTIVFAFFFQIIVGVVYWSKIDRSNFNEDRNNFGYFYSIASLLVSCLYFYYWQNSRKITRKISEQEYQLLNLEKLKTTAELGALQARINPHFLYNSLNSIASLVHSDPDKAEQMTVLLSKFFRYTTDRNNEHFNSIAEELEIVRTYLSIEQVRFGDRLKFTTNLENGLEKAQIPRFLLQPIVENAVKHGISKSSEEGKIEIDILKNENNILISIHDNGQLFPEEMASGYGLRSIQEKLKLVYGEDASLEIRNEASHKAVVIRLKQ